jgi:hypothetical protein
MVPFAAVDCASTGAASDSESIAVNRILSMIANIPRFGDGESS